MPLPPSSLPGSQEALPPLPPLPEAVPPRSDIARLVIPYRPHRPRKELLS
ncbi:hypothetical protein L3556_10510 [Candidatus Synechococcus calcipolaris G9]|uniref:Uncharacterized protein n=1 Tax=Candidatus Synechococcus calcipolaris G9 TaxID=1497997 RepID=A0ABT6F0N5_9SYNE|nr:hypothetical protein [Candidatus Synechococcus calcipolaris]MDG2991358.1 hypothetical protein [Candidatus Synechococcus calcipolaris G9]